MKLIGGSDELEHEALETNIAPILERLDLANVEDVVAPAVIDEGAKVEYDQDALPPSMLSWEHDENDCAIKPL